MPSIVEGRSAGELLGGVHSEQRAGRWVPKYGLVMEGRSLRLLQLTTLVVRPECVCMQSTPRLGAVLAQRQSRFCSEPIHRRIRRILEEDDLATLTTYTIQRCAQQHAAACGLGMARAGVRSLRCLLGDRVSGCSHCACPTGRIRTHKSVSRVFAAGVRAIGECACVRMLVLARACVRVRAHSCVRVRARACEGGGGRLLAARQS